MRLVRGEALMSAGALVLLLLALVSVDDHVREQISLRLATRPSVTLVSAGESVRDLTMVIVEAVRDQSLQHAPLVIFTLAAIGLVIFMLRT